MDYVRTARSKGLKERAVIIGHVLRNSLIPVVTLIALGIPAIFAGAIITEQIFRVNGLGALLIIAIQGADIPLVQSLTFIFAVLIVAFNIWLILCMAFSIPEFGTIKISGDETIMTTTDTTLDIPELDEHGHKHRSLWGDVWEQFRKSKGAMIGTTQFWFS